MRSWAWYHPLLRETPKDHLISYHPHTGSSTVWANGTPALLYAKSQWSHCDHHDNMDTVTDYSSTIPPLLPATISTHTQRDRYDLKRHGEWGVKRECRREQCVMNTDRNKRFRMAEGRQSCGNAWIPKVFSHKFCSSSYRDPLRGTHVQITSFTFMKCQFTFMEFLCQILIPLLKTWQTSSCSEHSHRFNQMYVCPIFLLTFSPEE